MNKIIAKESTTNNIKSLYPTEKILPHRIRNAAPLAAWPGMKFRNIKARAIIIEKRKPITTLLSSRAFSASGPRISAVPNENITALIKGSNETINPNAAPANAA